MMKKIVWLVLLMVSAEAAVGQNQSNTPPYQVWVDRTGGTMVTGILNQVAQDHIQVISGFYTDQGKPGDRPHLNISSQEIQQLRLRRKGKVGRGIMIGAGIGAVTGVIIGLASGDDPDCGYDPNSPSLLVHFVGAMCEGTHMTAGQKAVLAGTGLGLVGGVVGGILGSIKIKIPINGSQNIFEANRPRLKGYAGGNY